MASVHDPVRDCSPEFKRRLDRDMQRFARRMFEIARGSSRFDRAEQVQAEVDRLLTLSDADAGFQPWRTR